MSIIINSSPLKDVLHNDNIVKKWIHNGIKVWERFSVTTATCRGNCMTIWGAGERVFPNGTQIISGPSRSLIPSDSCIQWTGSHCQWKAVTDCKVTLSGTMSLYAYDGSPTYYQCFLYKNGKHVVNLFATRGNKGQYLTGQINYTFNMSAGDTAYVAIKGGGGEASYRAQFEGGISINTFPI